MEVNMPALQLTKTSLEARDTAADNASIAQRIEAFRHIFPTPDPALIITEDAGQNVTARSEVPEVTAGELNAEGLRRALADHGALIVRNMFSTAEAETLTEAIDHILSACYSPRAARSKFSSTYFNPPKNLASIMPNKEKELGVLRLFNNAGGAAMTVEAPSVAEALLLLYEKYGIKKLITEYLGEPPCLSVKKWVLRRSKLPIDGAEWHQDGAFMGTNINSINMWIPLTYCGGETGAPGMDVVPQRMHSIAGADGATYDWLVRDELVSSGAFKVPPIAPVFNAGDVFFFDHLYLHRTQSRDDFSRIRYAVETWFFGSTTFPKSQVPLAW